MAFVAIKRTPLFAFSKKGIGDADIPEKMRENATSDAHDIFFMKGIFLRTGVYK
jgi:hypothetical protein